VEFCARPGVGVCAFAKLCPCCAVFVSLVSLDSGTWPLHGFRMLLMKVFVDRVRSVCSALF